MGVKLIITEKQLSLLRQRLNEDNFHESLVEKLVKDLDMNYEPMLGVMRDGGEYYEKPMIKIKVDDGSISPKNLFDYFKKKYKLGDEFIQQVIKDWMFGRIENNRLSKNVSIS